MADSAHLNELGEFLKARRAELSPRTVGLPEPRRRRRVTGLRREEVAVLNTDFAAIPEKKRNYVRHIFTDPAMRSLYPDWETAARNTVAVLRRRAAARPDDPEQQLIISIAEPGSHSYDGLRFLASWAMTQPASDTINGQRGRGEES